MRKLPALLTLLLFTLSTHAQLVPKDAVPEKVADGYKFTEGPALGPDGCIYFTDIPASLIVKYDPETNKAKTFREGMDNTNGLFWHDENLYMCSHGARAVRYFIFNKTQRDSMKRSQTNENINATDGLFGPSEKEIDQPISIVSNGLTRNKQDKDTFAILNSPNDLAIDKDGNIYFTDPRYGNRDSMEMEIEGVYYHGDEHIDGNPNHIRTIYRAIDFDLTRPNGIVLSPDESILYVADNGANYIYAYDIESPGKVKNKRVFGRINDGKGGGSDGMTVDAKGRLYATGHSKVWVFEPTGQLVATIPVGMHTTNCTFAADGKTLYITANNGLYRITLNTDSPLEHAAKQE